MIRVETCFLVRIFYGFYRRSGKNSEKHKEIALSKYCLSK